MDAITVRVRLTLWDYFLLFSFVGFVGFVDFYLFPLSNKEALFAEIAREMSAGSWLIPQLNFVPYLAHPPLTYWLLKLSFLLFGPTTLGARFVAVLILLCFCFLPLYMGKKLNRPMWGYIASFVLASSFGFIVFGHLVSDETLFALFLSLSLLNFFLWFDFGDLYYNRYATVFMALAVLTKGLWPVILVFVICKIYVWSKRNLRARKIFGDRVALGLFLLIALPWFVYATLTVPGFWHYYLIHDHVYGFIQQFSQATEHGVFYYIPRIIFYLFPWVVLFPAIFFMPKQDDKSTRDFVQYCWLWLVVSILLNSINAMKTDIALILITIPYALLVAYRIENYFKEGNSRSLISAFAFVVVITFFLIIMVIFSSEETSHVMEAIGHLAIPLTIFMVFYTLVGFLIMLRYRKNPFVPFYLLVVLVVPLLMGLIAVAKLEQHEYSYLSMAQYLSQQTPARPVGLYKRYDDKISLQFYLQQRVAMIDDVSETLRYGFHLKQNDVWFLDGQQFRNANNNQAIFVVVKNSDWDEFAKKYGDMKLCQVFRDEQAVLLSNRDCALIH